MSFSHTPLLLAEPQMETIAPADPLVAFPDQHSEPTDRDLMLALGATFPPIGQIFSELQTSCPTASTAWQYSARSGWYRLALLKKRRLLYLIPKRGDFRLMLILGGKAIASLKNGPHAQRLEALLKTAKRYPEGTAFSFDHTSCDPSLIAALLAAKIAH